MPAWNEYKKAAKERGSLALELYVTESTPSQPMDKVKALLPEHLAYQAELEKSGKLAFAGPLSDDSCELMEGVGLIIYRANSLEEAKELADKDPMHANNVRSYKLRRWLINEGSLNLNVGLSTKQVNME